MVPPRLGVFDFGSNSLKFSLYERTEDVAPRLIDETREFTSVGEDVFSIGHISAAKAVQVEEAIERLKTRLNAGDAIRAAATSSFRDASNGEQMAMRFSQTLGAPIPVLDGLEEAALIAEGVLAGRCEPSAVLDIGGGSVEVIRCADPQEVEVISLDLGASRLRQQFAQVPDHEPPASAMLEAIDRYVRISLEALDPLPEGIRLHGSGGGFTTLGAVLLGDENRPDLQLSLEDLREASARVRDRSAEQLVEEYMLPLHRARIMAAGAIVAVRAVEHLQAKQITISWAGLREGLAWRWIRGE